MTKTDDTFDRPNDTRYPRISKSGTFTRWTIWEEGDNSAGVIVSSLLIAVSLLLLLPASAEGQGADPMIRTAMSADSNLYVYHTFKVSVGHGVNIYRRSQGDSYQKLNEQPIQGAQGALEFRSMVSDYMDRIMATLEIEDPNYAFHRLRADRITSNLVTFYYPDVARALGRLYVDSTATPGREWTYKVEVVDAERKPLGDSLVKTVTPRLERPDPPTDLDVKHEGRDVTLSWHYPTTTRVTDDKVVRFKIYRRVQEGAVQLNEQPIVRINNFNEFTHNFTSPVMGDTLKLFVTAVNIATRQSPPSDILSFYIRDNVPPSVISNVEATPRDDGNVELTWPVHTERDVKGYHVYRSRNIQGEYERLTEELQSVLDPFYVDQPPETRKTYYYRISAVDSAGNESDSSNAAMADVPDNLAPPTPTNVNAAALNSDSVRISWQLSDRPDDFKSFYVIRRQEGRTSGPAQSQVNDGALTDTFLVDKGEADINLADGGRYRYGVLSADSARNFSDTVFTSIKIPDLTPPERPTRIQVEIDEGLRALIRWNQSTSRDLSEYRLYRRPADRDTAAKRLATLPKGQTMARDTGVVKGNRYVYAVSAVDSLDNESDTLGSRPFLMRDYQAPRKVYNARARMQGDSLIIRWDPVTAPDLKGYRVYRSKIPTGIPQIVTKEAIQDNRYVKTGVDTARYWYRVRAVDESGNEGDASDAVTP